MYKKAQPPIPARVLFSSLEPFGVGSADCESLPGYVARLAAIHGVSPYELADYVRSLPRIEGERYAHEGGPKPYWGKTPGLFAVRLARLTGVPSVATLGMPWADLTIAFRKHVRKNPVWCPMCWQEDLNAGRPTYHRLLWSFDLHGHCHRHGTMLEVACPHCGFSAQGGRTGLPSTQGCRQCGGDLLRARDAGRAAFESSRRAEPSAWDGLLAQRFADLVAEMPALGQAAHWPDLERAVEMIKVRAGLEFQMDVIREARTNVQHLNQMRRPERMRSAIGISAVVRFAAAAEVPIKELLIMGRRRGEFLE